MLVIIDLFRCVLLDFFYLFSFGTQVGIKVDYLFIIYLVMIYSFWCSFYDFLGDQSVNNCCSQVWVSFILSGDHFVFL